LYIIFALLLAPALFILPGRLEPQIIYPILLILLGALTVVARLRKASGPFHDLIEISFLILLISYIVTLLGLYRFIPLPQIVYILLLILYFLGIRKESRFEYLITRGRFEGIALPAILIAVLSIAGLSLWHLFLSDSSYEQYLPDLPLIMLIPGGILFALLNAAYEELLFRGILLRIFRRAIGVAAAVLLQAFWFGIFHFAAGFPNGFIGIGLTFAFGLGTGYVA
jgi:membrane protease YdiL (CAAX protease family)